MALIDKPERARQLARAIASDLSLYHEKKLIEGIEKDTLFDVMRDEIDEGRALYKSRVTPEIFTMGIYDRALVDMLMKSRGARPVADLVATAEPATTSRRFVVAADGGRPAAGSVPVAATSPRCRARSWRGRSGRRR